MEGAAEDGVGAGVAMGLSRSVEWLTLPLFVIAQAAPMAAIIPMITYVYGIGLTAKVLAVTVLAVAGFALGHGETAMLAGALYYMLASTLGTSALFLISEPMSRNQGGIATLLALSAEAYAIDAAEEAYKLQKAALDLKGAW